MHLHLGGRGIGLRFLSLSRRTAHRPEKGAITIIHFTIYRCLVSPSVGHLAYLLLDASLAVGAIDKEVVVGSKRVAVANLCCAVLREYEKKEKELSGNQKIIKEKGEDIETPEEMLTMVPLRE